MKMVINERQYAFLSKEFKKTKKSKEMKEQDATPSLAPISPAVGAPMRFNKDEFFSPAPRTLKYNAGAAPSAQDYPAYPETTKWESGVTRGPANQIGITKWEDTVGSSLTRGKANPLK